MLESLYTGLTGLSTFSKGLSNISGNIANLNTPGFKRSQVTFTDLLYNQQNAGGSGSGGNEMRAGNGVDIGNTSVVFKQGELRQTGNDSDVAIDGNGFFILRKDGETFYTRAGQFELDKDGYLVSRTAEARVAVLGNGNQLQEFNISAHQVSPPKPSSQITLVGNLSTSDSDDLHTVSGINVFSSDGQTNTFAITFKDNTSVTPRSWTFQVVNQNNVTVSSGEIRFEANGSPTAGFESHTFSFTPSGGEPQTIKLDFGSPGKFSGITNFSQGADSTVKAPSVDGNAAGTLSKLSYDDEGWIVLEYSNGQTEKQSRLALAWFNFMSGLEQVGGNLFVNDTDQAPIIGAAKTSVFGSTTGGAIESSNVDLTQQFSELIVTQRGYQASSQVLSAANEMIQQLLDLKGRR